MGGDARREPVGGEGPPGSCPGGQPRVWRCGADTGESPPVNDELHDESREHRGQSNVVATEPERQGVSLGDDVVNPKTHEARGRLTVEGDEQPGNSFNGR